MTLSEMADYVTEVYGKTDASTVATCKKFLRHRYRMICDSSLWKDMLGVLSAPVSSRVVILPEDVDRVVHVVFDSQSMDVNDLIRDAIVNPQNISTADSSGGFAAGDTGSTSTSSTVSTTQFVRVQDGKLQIQDTSTGLWYDVGIASDMGAPAITVEGAGE